MNRVLRKMTIMRYQFPLVGLILLLTVQSAAQVNRVAAGLVFSSGTEFNSGETGNPGIIVKTWIGLDKGGAFHIVPSLSMYNRYKLENGYLNLYNYMFHGDLNAQYSVFQDGTVRLVAFGGGNFTYLISEFEPLVIIPNQTLDDARGSAFGGNLGAGLELRMSSRWDFNVTGKYLFSRYSQFIISVEGVYYFTSRRRGYWG
jgi:hypothetical protein